MHHLPDPFLHHLREPAHPAGCGDGPRRGAGGHLPGRRLRLRGDGTLRQLSHRPGPGDGAERLLRRGGGGHPGHVLAGRPGCGFLLRVPDAGPLRAAGAGMGGQQHSTLAEDGHRRGDRLLPGDHRPAQCRGRGGQRSHPGNPRRPDPVDRGAGRSRVQRSRCPRALEGARLGADLHSGGGLGRLDRRSVPGP